MLLPGHKAVLAPGMSQVIEAGEYYTLRDDNNEELELIGKLDGPTIDFLRAFAAWDIASRQTGPNSDITKAAQAKLFIAWNKLGKHAVEAIESTAGR